MALTEQRDKGKKEDSEESFIIKFSNPLFASYVIATTLHYSYVYQIPQFFRINCTKFLYRDADKFLARPTSLSIIFSVQGTGGSPRPDPENRWVIKKLEAQVGQLFPVASAR
jgi:hypothetical protein